MNVVRLYSPISCQQKGVTMMVQLAYIVWVVDVLLKVFPSTLPPAALQNSIVVTCAGNEWESAQIAFRSEKETRELRVSAVSFRQVNGTGVIGSSNIHCQFVGFISIQKNTPSTPSDELICKAPEQIPDVLREESVISVPAGFTQPIWIDLFVPKDTPAGDYEGEISIEADGEKTTVPVKVHVYGFSLPEERNLLMTNWFNTGNIAKAHGVELWSDAFFGVLADYARNMAEHRENVFLISPWTIKAWREADGKLTFDYSIFDRYVQTFIDAGVNDRIEISHVAHHGEGGWESKEILLSEVQATDRQSGQSVSLSPEEGLGPFLVALQNHLAEKGWLERSMIHVCDEPSDHNFEPWKKASEFVHRYAPQIRRIDAIETAGFEGLLEVWVPKLNQVYHWYPYYDRARKSGNELWFYICLHPTGRWMNRFLDYPLMKVRLLHWINYRYDIPGYLHWGWNFWGDDPFGPPQSDLPPGDTHVVYPGKNGPLNSIRWQTQRDSVEDFEYLKLLEKQIAETAERLGNSTGKIDTEARSLEYCSRIVRSFTDYERNADTLRKIRDELAKEVESTIQEPLILFNTLPSQDTPFVPSPAVLLLEGVTRPGAKLTVNDREIRVREDGTFQALIRSLGRQNILTVRVEREGKTKILQREYMVLNGKE